MSLNYNVYFAVFTDYANGIKLMSRLDHMPVLFFNARNDHDREKFVDDLRESIAEVLHYSYSWSEYVIEHTFCKM